MIINETSKFKHVTVYDKLYELITNGNFPVGYQLPSEPDLAVKMGVSRVTLRKSLALLHEDGLIVNIRGKGNFVVDPDTSNPNVEYIKRIQNPFPVCSKQKVFDTEIGFRFEPQTDPFLKLMEQETSVVVITDRWYKVNDEAIGYSLSFLPIELISNNKVDLNNPEQFSNFLNAEIYSQAFRAKTQFSFTTTGNFTADKYNLSENDHFILILEVLYSKENKPLITTKHYIPSDNFKLQINLTDKIEL